MKSFSVAYEKNYGLENKTGWNIVEDGIFIITFEKFLFIALIKWMIKRRNK